MERQRGLQQLSSNSAFAISDHSDHEIHLAQPDLVVKAIRAVLEAVQSGNSVRLVQLEQSASPPR